MSEKNHYLPIFYQRRWATGADEQVCVYFKNPRRHEVRRRHPSGIGYHIDLYTVPGVDLGTATYLEREFFQVTDDLAAKSLAALEESTWNMNAAVRSGWTRFITSLLHRNPEQISRSLETVSRYVRVCRPLYEGAYRKNKDAASPPTFEEFWAENRPHILGRTWIRLVQSTIDSATVGNHFNGLLWEVFELHGDQTFLTGDRPIIMTNGMVNPGSHLSIPIGPRKLFVAATDNQVFRSLRRFTSNELASFSNDLIVRQSRRFCIGEDKSHLDLFAARFGEMRPSMPMEEMPLPTDEELREMFLTDEVG